MSTLLIDEAFSKGDDSFLRLVRGCNSSKYLAALADRWKKDPRPWARRMQMEYLELPLSCHGHHPLVKRLFKEAERAGDRELMAAFLVAFDRLVRRRLVNRYQWDSVARASYDQEVLAPVSDQIRPEEKPRTARNPRTGTEVTIPSSSEGSRLFSYPTRHHLRRRAWRFFRRLGFQKPAEYAAAVSPALRLYRDDDLAKGENILDSRSLLAIAFGGGDVLEFTQRHARLREGKGLADLKAAPRFPEAWNGAMPLILSLVLEARSRLVRTWAIQLFRKDHVTADVPVETLLRFLDHPDGEVQQFAADVLLPAAGMARLPVPAWLRLLETKNLTAVGVIAEAMAKHVTADRVDVAQAVALAGAAPSPVARLGLAFLRQKKVEGADRAAVAGLADAKCAALAREAAAWALPVLSDPYDRDGVTRFFDSLQPGARAAAWDWLTEKAPGWADAALWARLAESPFDDVRLRLVEALDRRAAAPAADLSQVWSAVLLGVHRGGRQKARAARQLADAVARDPKRADQLLPVLRVAVRSIRGPEARAGLAAVATAATKNPALVEALKKHVPELHLRTECVL